MSDPFLGEIRPFAFMFAPANWLPCNGQKLSITQYTALFSLLGTRFGGDGRTSFGLPNLNGSVAVGAGQGTGLSSWALGQTGGTAAVLLDSTTTASHTHSLTATANPATTQLATNTQLALASTDNGVTSFDALIYTNNPPNTQQSGVSLIATGGGGTHGNMMPTLTMNYCIAIAGAIYPSFN